MSLKNFLPLRREVMEHWVYKDNDYFKVWVEMLFRARFSEEPKKDIYEGSLYTINQGEFLFSRPKWCLRLNVKDHKLKKLITLLIKEEMITKVGRVGKSGATIYFINNYQKYNNYATQTPALTVGITDLEGDSRQPKANDKTAKHQRKDNDTPLKNKVKSEKKERMKEYTSNSFLLQTLLDYDEMRKTIKKPTTLRAVNTMLKKLDGLADTDEHKISILEQSIEKCYLSIFEVKGYNISKPKSKQKSQEIKLDSEEW